MSDYRSSGVDIDAGDRAVELMKRHVETTRTPGVLGSIGSFGGLFRPDLAGMEEPVLVSGTDGVGTKLKLAFAMDIHDSVGVDCVAMCVNDIISMGATPLFFLDYIAIGRLEPGKIEKIVSGVCEGCRQASSALIGGETAEMPGLYAESEYDLAGFAVGLVDRQEIIDGSTIEKGDILVGWPSSGFHSNGFSLVRKIISDEKIDLHETIPGFSRPIGLELLTPTRIYVSLLERLKKLCKPKGIAHITGGGLLENLPRVIPEGLKCEIHTDSWEVPPVIGFIVERGGVEVREAYRTFNMGIGLVTAFSPDDADAVLQGMKDEKPVEIGVVVAGEGGVALCRRG